MSSHYPAIARPPPPAPPMGGMGGPPRPGMYKY